ncbi:sugar ABC transporter ATP-binding protein [Oscillibacter sp.]|uniref:sugar ABC transporter ATP-binding protein n=1 Tax=Oscillibacter sp. TaxID=1945593 RepID=UPI00261CE707|nr:sugar ABC transporter ATP-binding protein [Oscillibacter sp.]MDD3347640.1 sugar ABC transporter ATP-binding protein [Oscillibacter sp.]
MADFEMRGISKSFGNVHALVDADFSANKGDIMGLLGENGAGKSTLIKVLAGVVKADSGEVELFGKPVDHTTPKAAMRAGIRVVHQELSLVRSATVAENIFITEDEKTFTRKTLKDLNKRAQELFEKIDVDDLDPSAYVNTLPLASCQKIEIIKALAFDFDVLVLDEATSALTEKDAEWLFNLMEKLAAQGKILIFISHRLQEVNRICTRIIVYRNGTDVKVADKGELSTDEIVTEMLGRKMSGYYPEKENLMQDTVVLHVEDIRNETLNGISFDLHAGEILGVGGLSGQGQTALFEALYGAAKYTGAIEVGGKKTRMTHPSVALANGIALVPEDRANQGLVLPLSVKENISLASLSEFVKGGLLNFKAENAAVDEMIKELQIKTDTPEVPVVNLSGGNQQKVVLAKQLLAKPDILLMYDITRGVDVGTKREMFNLMVEHCRKGKAVLFFSTDTEELTHMCNSVYVMYEGRFKAHLKDDEITAENIIRASVGESAV